MKENKFSEMIRRAGFRATKPRLLLLALLQRSTYPIHIQEIVEGLGRNTIDQVTVYRMIDAFKKADIIREINLQGERPRYELADTKHDHHHIVCTNCRKLEDFVGCDVTEVEKKALRQSRSFVKITGHSFDLYGLCKSCAK